MPIDENEEINYKKEAIMNENNDNLEVEGIDNMLVDCPYCKEEIKKEAVKCKHCGVTLKSKFKDFVLKIKAILVSKILWRSFGGLTLIALAIYFIGIPLFDKYETSQKAIKQYNEYVQDKKNNKRNIYRILEEYQDLDTPIDKLNQKIKEVNKLISSKKFDQLIKIEAIGGYASKGPKISMTSGYGTILKDYVTVTNLTDIPLEIYFTFDLQRTTYTTKEHIGWIMKSYSTDVDEYIYQKDNTDRTRVYSKEKDTARASFDDVRYYDGYHVTRQFNDGSYKYDYDGSKSFKAVNLKIKSIKIYK